MSENMFCPGMKCPSSAYVRNWDIIFKRYWVRTDKLDTYVQCRKIDDKYLVVRDDTFIDPTSIVDVQDHNMR